MIIMEQTFSSICRILQCKTNIPAWPDVFGNAIKDYIVANKIPFVRTLSLFSGAGGLDIGFNDVGFEIVESVEIEKEFCKTLELNTGEGKRFNRSKVNCIDIRDYNCKDLGKIDFIIGGPPCQTFSAAGRRANGVLGTTDSRGILFKEYVRILKDLSPIGFLFENVYGIIGAQNGEPWSDILNSFSSIGYKLFYRVLDAADYGVPQHRERLIIVGLKEGEFKFPRPTHGPDSLDNQPFFNAKDAIFDLRNDIKDIKIGIGGRYGHLLNDIPPGLNYSFYTEKMGHPNPVFAWRSKFSDFLYKADPNEPVRTIKASGGAYTGPFHWENRCFSCEEYKRLQTFPDDYEISGTKQIAIKQIGNSVPPQLARMLAIAIRQQVFGTVFPFTLSFLEESEQLTFRTRKHELSKVYKEKAKQAIDSLVVQKKDLIRSYTYYCDITKDFLFRIAKEICDGYHVRVDWGEILLIEIRPLTGDVVDPKIKIVIEPANENWILNVSKVLITVYDDSPKAFTMAWKTFDYELSSNSIKADLIQLNGYYQYASNLKCFCSLPENFMYKNVIEGIVSGSLVSMMLLGRDLSCAWKIKENELLQVAEYLKSLGYEIRNHRTNPQIEEGYWLIPYAFPTLTSQSVQLRKKVK